VVMKTNDGPMFIDESIKPNRSELIQEEAKPTAPKDYVRDNIDPKDYGINRDTGKPEPVVNPTINVPTAAELEKIRKGTVESAEVKNTASTFVDEKVNAMIEDPAKYVADNNLNQTYTPQAVQNDEILDVNTNALGEMDPLEATTTKSPTRLNAVDNVTVDSLSAADSVGFEAIKAAEAVQVKNFSASLINVNDLTKAVDEIAKLEPMKAASMAKREMDPLEATTTKSPTRLNAVDNVTVDSLSAADSVGFEAIKAAEAVQVKNFSASLINVNDLTKAVDEIAKLEPMKAASMAKEMDALLAGMEEGNVPIWARPAVTQVEQMLAGRGISASSVGRDALFNAIIQSALPIAQQDATFKQESYKVNYNAKVQAVLSDVNMEFAAKQFNANSINQTNQFRAQLTAQVDMQNASRQDAMSQFNTNLTAQLNLDAATRQDRMSQFNTDTQSRVDMNNAARTDNMSQFNTQTEVATNQFNAAQVNSMVQLDAQLQSGRDQFNANMATQLEQSNVNWRRQVNSANTAGENAVNQANVQNAFNLSNQALTFLWQEQRDEAHWANQASEAEKLRKAEKEIAILTAASEVGAEAGSTVMRLIEGSQFLADFLGN
jgi:hypothetical protein